MPIRPKCDVCAKELDSFGGLILSPPDKKHRVRKYHICKSCFSSLTKEFKR